MNPRVCVCGTEIPATGTTWTPQCRFCEQTKLRRALAEIDD